VRRLALDVVRLPVAAIALACLAAFAVVLRIRGRRPATDAARRPRLVFGPTPILSFTYLSRALRTVGYETTTLVDARYRIHGPDDFDLDRDRFFAGRPLRGPARWLDRLVGDYVVFAWVMRRFGIVHTFFDGGFLRHTPLRFREAQLLHLAGRRLIVMPYGSDVAVPSRIASDAWRRGLARNYPHLAAAEPATIRQIEYFSRHADFIVGCIVHVETLARWDLLPIHYYPIDTDLWAADRPPTDRDGRNGAVTIVHAPNHRAMKGTEFVIAACGQLRAEGLQAELRLLEGMTNAEVRRAMAEADIVVEQLLLGYGLNAMEGMSLGKPVISNLTDDRYYAAFRRETRLAECPIVSTDPEHLLDVLRRLVTEPDEWARAGAAAREWVVEEHSYAAMARLWEGIYRRVWWREAVDLEALIRPASAA